MRVAQISFYVDPQAREPLELLSAWPSLTETGACAASAGAEVTIFQAAQHTQSLERDGLSYHFLPFGRSAPGRADGQFLQLLRELQPDALHVHGLDFGPDVAGLTASYPQAPILVQDHAARVPRIWRRRAMRQGLMAADGVAFCARDQALEFVAAGLIAPTLPVFAIPESTSRFTPDDRAAARALTSLTGDPAILWVGNLTANKDPLTVLEGVRLAAAALPGLQLHFCFGEEPLLAELRRRIAMDPVLKTRVHLRGRVPHAYVQQLMRAADLFVLGSAREGSGYALIEALACGLPPVVTDIPSFRALTGDGVIGRLWPHGDAAALAAALVDTQRLKPAAMRARVREHFDAELSVAAVGRKLLAAYAALVSRRAGRRVSGL